MKLHLHLCLDERAVSSQPGTNGEIFEGRPLTRVFAHEAWTRIPGKSRELAAMCPPMIEYRWKSLSGNLLSGDRLNSGRKEEDVERPSLLSLSVFFLFPFFTMVISALGNATLYIFMLAPQCNSRKTLATPVAS